MRASCLTTRERRFGRLSRGGRTCRDLAVHRRRRRAWRTGARRVQLRDVPLRACTLPLSYRTRRQSGMHVATCSAELTFVSHGSNTGARASGAAYTPLTADSLLLLSLTPMLRKKWRPHARAAAPVAGERLFHPLSFAPPRHMIIWVTARRVQSPACARDPRAPAPR